MPLAFSNAWASARPSVETRWSLPSANSNDKPERAKRVEASSAANSVRSMSLVSRQATTVTSDSGSARVWAGKCSGSKVMSTSESRGVRTSSPRDGSLGSGLMGTVSAGSSSRVTTEVFASPRVLTTCPGKLDDAGPDDLEERDRDLGRRPRRQAGQSPGWETGIASRRVPRRPGDAPRAALGLCEHAPALLPCGETRVESGSNLIDTTRALGQVEAEGSGWGFYPGRGFERVCKRLLPQGRGVSHAGVYLPAAKRRALVGERGLRGPEVAKRLWLLGGQEVREGKGGPARGKARPLWGRIGANQILPALPRTEADWTRRKRAVKGEPFRVAFSGHGGPEKAAKAARRASPKSSSRMRPLTGLGPGHDGAGLGKAASEQLRPVARGFSSPLAPLSRKGRGSLPSRDCGRWTVMVSQIENQERVEGRDDLHPSRSDEGR